MNIVFFGSSNFAAPALRALLNSQHKISCVVTKRDKKRGRGLALGSTAIKTVAGESNLKIYQPERINTREALSLLKDLKPDLFVVIAYGQILSQEILDVPRIFPINVHASILPRYRGAAPINWAIINGEKATGITVIKMVKEMDAGPIILQKEVEINEDDTAVMLEEKLSCLAGELFLTALTSIEDNDYKLMPQNQDNITFAPKLKKEDGRIKWSMPAQEIRNLIRGCISWPGAFTYYNGKLLKIYKARVLACGALSASLSPGEITGVSKEGITVITGKDNLIIEELQIEGKRRMRAEEFIAGHKIGIGQRLDKK